mgnify:CR=1 FL=1
MQAIARVNRVFKGKEGGLVADYLLAMTRELTEILRKNRTIYSDISSIVLHPAPPKCKYL